MKLIVKTLYLGVLVSIVIQTASILVIFIYNLKAPRFIIFRFDSKKVKIEARDSWESFNLFSLEIIIKLDFDEQ